MTPRRPAALGWVGASVALLLAVSLRAEPGAPLPPPVPEPSRSAVPPPPLPDPGTWKQSPRPVTEAPRPSPHVPKADVGVDSGIVFRPARGGPIHYGPSWAVGGHVRVDLRGWLAARVHARFEGSSVSFDDGALGLPSGTSYDQPGLHRVLLGAMLEPTWKPLPHLALWVGTGIGWARTTAGTFHSTGAETVVIPTRASVLVEVPLSLGVRYEIVPRWLVVSASGAVGFLTSQSGNLLRSYDTPGRTGRLVEVGGFPEFGTSFAALAGLGVLL